LICRMSHDTQLTTGILEARINVGSAETCTVELEIRSRSGRLYTLATVFGLTRKETKADGTLTMIRTSSIGIKTYCAAGFFHAMKSSIETLGIKLIKTLSRNQVGKLQSFAAGFVVTREKLIAHRELAVVETSSIRIETNPTTSFIHTIDTTIETRGIKLVEALSTSTGVGNAITTTLICTSRRSRIWRHISIANRTLIEIWTCSIGIEANLTPSGGNTVDATL